MCSTLFNLHTHIYIYKEKLKKKKRKEKRIVEQIPREFTLEQFPSSRIYTQPPAGDSRFPCFESFLHAIDYARQMLRPWKFNEQCWYTVSPSANYRAVLLPPIHCRFSVLLSAKERGKRKKKGDTLCNPFDCKIVPKLVNRIFPRRKEDRTTRFPLGSSRGLDW